MLKKFMKDSLEKYGGRVYWYSIKRHVNWDTMPEPCKKGASMCFSNLLGICPHGAGCSFKASHNIQLNDEQAHQAKRSICSGVQILYTDGPDKSRKRPRNG